MALKMWESIFQAQKTFLKERTMENYQIKNRWSRDVIYETKASSLKEAVQKAVKKNVNLRGADLRNVDLRNVDLRGTDLRGADLEGADLRGTDLRGTDLEGADLRGTDLRNVDLRGADLRGANLEGAEIEFHLFPSIRLLSSMPLGELPNNLTLELMRRDAYAHPHPDRFDDWAKNQGDCPYQNEDRFWYFQEKKELWKAGKPTMIDRDLIIAICKEKDWKIKTLSSKNVSIARPDTP